MDLRAPHDFYCTGEAWGAPVGDRTMTFESWGDFFGEFGDSDMDYNLVFRWDWVDAEDTGEADRLCVFFMQQRKGRFLPVVVKNVTDEDMPAIASWLRPRWEYMRGLWAPFSG